MSEHATEPTVRLRLDIAYDGTNFSGWTKQPGLRTVQGVIEAALELVFQRSGPAPKLTVAGRTDAGVHAIGQVAHLDLTRSQLAGLDARNGGGDKRHGGVAALARRLNGIIGPNSDINISSVAIAPPGFDARFSAIWRRYEYRVADASHSRNPLLRNHTLWYPVTLDVEAMDKAARSLVGLHDWASYCKPREGSTTIRTLQDFRWERLPDGLLVARVKADAFCHSMVRALVGACIAVGEGKLAGDQLLDIREGQARTSAFKVVPANGLTLVEVGYPDDADLAARALQTRARREPPLAFDRHARSGLI